MTWSDRYRLLGTLFLFRIFTEPFAICAVSKSRLSARMIRTARGPTRRRHFRVACSISRAAYKSVFVRCTNSACPIGALGRRRPCTAAQFPRYHLCRSFGSSAPSCRGPQRRGLRQYLERAVLPFRCDPPGGFLIALRAASPHGPASEIVRFGPTADDGNHGGTGVWVHDGYVYAETNDKIVRYKLPDNGISPTGPAETIAVRPAADRRSSDAPDGDRSRGRYVRRSGIGDQRVPEPESHRRHTRHRSVHRIGNARRHLAL